MKYEVALKVNSRAEFTDSGKKSEALFYFGSRFRHVVYAENSSPLKLVNGTPKGGEYAICGGDFVFAAEDAAREIWVL